MFLGMKRRSGQGFLIFTRNSTRMPRIRLNVNDLRFLINTEITRSKPFFIWVHLWRISIRKTFSEKIYPFALFATQIGSL
ncbi:MAG: hypothetical protein DCC56_07895 [Anaerolineae bacterium]|nr:MAG: hypothetical protein DCC56_07895 [Anaerolineae bacterium]